MKKCLTNYLFVHTKINMFILQRQLSIVTRRKNLKHDKDDDQKSANFCQKMDPWNF